MDLSQEKFDLFMEVTGENDIEKCRQMLTFANGSVERAIENYYNLSNIDSTSNHQLNNNNNEESIDNHDVIGNHSANSSSQIVNYPLIKMMKIVVSYPFWFLFKVFYTTWIHSWAFVKSLFITTPEEQRIKYEFDRIYDRIGLKYIEKPLDDLKTIEIQTKKPFLIWVDDLLSSNSSFFFYKFINDPMLSKYIQDNYNFVYYHRFTSMGIKVIEKYGIYTFPWLKVISINSGYSERISWDVYSFPKQIQEQLSTVLKSYKQFLIINPAKLRQIQDEEYQKSLEKDRIQKDMEHKKKQKLLEKNNMQMIKDIIAKNAMKKLETNESSGDINEELCNIRVRYSHGQNVKYRLNKAMSIEKLCYHLINDGLFNENSFKKSFSLRKIINKELIVSVRLDPASQPDYLQFIYSSSNNNSHSINHDNSSSINHSSDSFSDTPISIDQLNNQTLNLSFDSDSDCTSSEDEHHNKKDL